MFMVFFSHCGAFFSAPSEWGAIAVGLFFVISGFLIGYGHFDKNVDTHKSLLQSCVVYVKSKYRKFYLLYMIMLLVSIPLTIWGVVSGNVALIDFFIKLCVHSTLLQCLVPDSSFILSFNWPSWYLSTSVVIYFFVPIILKFVRWLFKYHYVWSFLIMTTTLNLLIVIIIAPQAKDYDVWYYIFYLSPYIRIFHFTQAFCVGAYLKKKKDAEKYSFSSATIKEILVVAFFVAFTILSTRISLVYSYIIPIPLSILMVYVLAQQKGGLSKILANRFMLFISIVSFEFYLIHRMVLVYADSINRHFLQWNGYWVAFICCIFTLFLSFAYKRFNDRRIGKV